MENSERYLNALIQRVITGRTPKELRLNGFKRTEYEREMGEMYEGFRLEVLSGSYSIPEFIAITRKVEEAKKQVVSFQRIVERTETTSPMFRPIQALCGCYKRQVEKTAELVESVNILKLSQTNSFAAVFQQVPTPQVSTSDGDTQSIVPAEEIQVEPIEKPEEAEPKQPRRNFNETNTSHPGEYWGYKEMEKGEGIAHSTAWNIVKNPYYLPAIRFVGRNLRVNIAKLHELQQKAAAEKHKPIGDHPKRTRK